MLIHGVASLDKSEALFSCTKLSSGPSLHTSPLRLPGLDPDRRYDVRPLLLEPQPVAPARGLPAWLVEGARMTGRQLEGAGITAPILYPDTTLLIHLTRADSASAVRS